MRRLKSIFSLGLFAASALLSSCGSDDKKPAPAPSISGFTPTSGEVGAGVTISGINFSTVAAENQVKFGAIAATVSAATATSITTSVPTGATTSKISVTVNGQTATSATDFTVNFSPSITSFAPSSGEVGTTVTITGANFSTTASNNTVKFNGTVATVTAASGTSLTVTVPTSATKGKITVEVNGKAATSTDDFTITGWQRKTDFAGAARVNGSGFVLNSKVYFGLGIKGFAGANVIGGADFWEYDPATNAWTQKANHPAITDGAGSGTASEPVSFAINGKGYVALGSLRAVWEYDPTANSWTMKNQNHPLGTSVSLQSPFAFVANGKAYIGGGNNGTAQRALYEYDPVASTWTSKADFPETAGIYRTQAFAIGAKGYVGAGIVSSGTKRFWEYDVVTNTWKEIASYPGNNASDAVATALNGKGYVRVNNSLYEYNPTTNTWATKTYGRTINFAMAFTVNEQIFWAGGSGNLTKEFWAYLP